MLAPMYDSAPTGAARGALGMGWRSRRALLKKIETTQDSRAILYDWRSAGPRGNHPLRGG